MPLESPNISASVVVCSSGAVRRVTEGFRVELKANMVGFQSPIAVC